jgi:23S rRNA (uridine2552-2'-O)-methyltransferase
VSNPRSSSRSWKERQLKDPYVLKARRDGWRSRAVYKLEQIDQKERLLRKGMLCVDLGAAPGSWSQYVTEKLKGDVRIVAVDLLLMDSLPSVEFILGDFTDVEVLAAMKMAIGDTPVDLVISDMAPNISGNRAIDQPRSMYLAELAMELCKEVLKPGGNFICKLFQGEGIDEYIVAARAAFKRVKVMKPKASRPGSREVYLVARNYRL